MPLLGPYLFELLYQKGAKHAFGIPGDFALTLYDALAKSPIQPVGVTHEPCAGFAADVYARLTGLGLAVVTYSVGGINLANATAGAYAEKSPLFIVSGGPGVQERKERKELHHKIKTYDTQLRIFKEVTAYAAVLDDPKTAPYHIEQALSICLSQKRPVYLEIPRDQVYAEIEPIVLPVLEESLESQAFKEALAESITLLKEAQKPAILVDIEVMRFGLQNEVVTLAEALNAPVFCTLLGKSVFPEGHPNFGGVYSGHVGNPLAEEIIASSDGLLILGMIPSDINLGLYTASWNPSTCIDASFDTTRIKHHTYSGIDFVSYVKALSRCNFGPKKKAPAFVRAQKDIPIDDSQKISMRSLIAELNSFLTENMILLGDAGDALFAMADISSGKNTTIVHPSFYSSMGFAIPGSLGALLAHPQHKVVTLVGDGAFQMTGLELISIQKLGLRPIVIVLNNGAYASLASMGHGQSEFIKIPQLDYVKLAQAMGLQGRKVTTVGEFKQGLKEGLTSDKCLVLEVILDKNDVSPMLKKIGALFASTLKG